jgi:hypothetical protein
MSLRTALVFHGIKNALKMAAQMICQTFHHPFADFINRHEFERYPR